MADFEPLARARLDASAWAYLNGAAADELTHRANLAAWPGLRLWPRVLRPLGGGHTRSQLLGRAMAHPLLLAPVAHQQLAHADGECGSALAAAMQAAGYVLSSQSSHSPEAVSRLVRHEPGRGPLWFQLYLQHDRGFNRALLQQVAELGFEALVLTVDAPVQGPRNQEHRSGFALPADLQAAALRGLPPRPAPRLASGQSRVFDDLLTTAPRWDDLDWLLAESRLPVLLKGMAHPDDARQAVAAGAAGLIVSNHGGRALDTAPATAELLPGVVQAVRALAGPAGAVPVLVDGGIRRGTDVLKALALGASAVLVGRPVVQALAVGGAHGVARMLRLLRDELEVAMALTGCRTLADVGPQVLFQPPLA